MYVVNKNLIETEITLAVFVVHNMFCNISEAFVRCLICCCFLTLVSSTTAVRHEITYM